MFRKLFLAVPRGCLRFVIVVFPDHTHLLFLALLLLKTCSDNRGDNASREAMLGNRVGNAPLNAFR